MRLIFGLPIVQLITFGRVSAVISWSLDIWLCCFALLSDQFSYFFAAAFLSHTFDEYISDSRSTHQVSTEGNCAK